MKKANYAKLYTDYYRHINNMRPLEDIERDRKVCALTLAIIITLSVIKVVNASYKVITKPAENVEQMIVVDDTELKEIQEAQKRAEAYRLKLEEENKQNKLQDKIDELNENFTRGDWVIITWWRNPSPSPTPPRDASRTGQITKIVDDKVYGTWGSYPLTYQEDVWHRCSKAEYLQARADEQRKRDKENKKKKFVSWGIHPSTVK